jgi:hypothetical protein
MSTFLQPQLLAVLTNDRSIGIPVSIFCAITIHPIRALEQQLLLPLLIAGVVSSSPAN